MYNANWQVLLEKLPFLNFLRQGKIIKENLALCAGLNCGENRSLMNMMGYVLRHGNQIIVFIEGRTEDKRPRGSRKVRKLKAMKAVRLTQPLRDWE